MNPRHSARSVATVVLLSLAAACGRDTNTLEPATAPTDALVFSDNFGPNATYQAFLDSKVDAVAIDTQEAVAGTASLKVTVPGPDDPSGFFAGGAFTTDEPRDLSGYNALTFWAKASKTATLNIAGLGNDNTGTSRYEASWNDLALTTEWAKHTIPIPLPAKLVLEGGLFFFAEGHEAGMGYDLWFDEIQFETVNTISNPRPALSTRSVNTFVGAIVSFQNLTSTTFDVAGTDQTINHSPEYFAFRSSDESVARIVDGQIEIVGDGSVTITASLGDVDATGEITLEVIGAPTEPAPTPTLPAADVLSLFSNANGYENVTVDTWSADWDRADLADFKIAGNDTKAFTNLVFAGIEFVTEPIDASAMTHFHVDLWVPGGTVFKVKLVDFGADGVFGGGDDSEHELTFNAGSTPALAIGAWVSLEVPLTDFTRLRSTAHLAQILLAGDVGTAYIDNLYFHK